MKYYIKKVANGEFYWVLKARNGETIATSLGETYKTRQVCIKGINLVKRSMFAPIVENTKI